jgi:hypothetical protein
MKWIFITLSVLLANAAFAQNESLKVSVSIAQALASKKANEILYKHGLKLKLTDFQGAPERGTDAVAMTYSGINLGYTSHIQNGETKVVIQIVALFDRSKSWCMLSARNEKTLEHEQHHLDITAINSCLLRNALLQYQFTENYVNEIAEIYKEYQQKAAEMQDDYDNATDYGIDQSAQLEWNSKVAKMLSSIDACY